MHRFKKGDRVIYARPNVLAQREDSEWTEWFVYPGAEGVVTYVCEGVYQYRVEHRYGPLVVRHMPFDRELDPAPEVPA